MLCGCMNDFGLEKFLAVEAGGGFGEVLKLV